jgi:tetratricopeptide (TPR) repeat protein
MTKTNFDQILSEILKNIDTQPHDNLLPGLLELHKFDGGNKEVLRALIHIYYSANDYDPAVKYLDKALRKYPNDGLFLMYNALIYDKIGDTVSCMFNLDKILALEQANCDVYDLYAKQLSEIGNYPAAIGISMRQLLNNKYKDPLQIVFRIAHYYFELGAHGVAVEIYDILLNKRPDNLNLLYNKAVNLSSSGHEDEAENILHDILKKDSKFKTAQELLTKIEKSRKEG